MGQDKVLTQTATKWLVDRWPAGCVRQAAQRGGESQPRQMEQFRANYSEWHASQNFSSFSNFRLVGLKSLEWRGKLWIRRDYCRYNLRKLLGKTSIQFIQIQLVSWDLFFRKLIHSQCYCNVTALSPDSHLSNLGISQSLISESEQMKTNRNGQRGRPKMLGRISQDSSQQG